MAKTVVLAILSAKGLRNDQDLKSHFVQTTFWYAIYQNHAINHKVMTIR